MIVITGCPRSGTSLMMQCLRAGLGVGRLFGEEFPAQAQRLRMEKRADGESEERYKYRMYVNRSARPDFEGDEKRARTMNPKGFWECPFTVNGISWSPGIADQAGELLDEMTTKTKRKKESFCKIVSGGLARSDPRFISKIVIMVRDPKSVAKSQENLARKFEYRIPGKPIRNLYDGMKINSPKMFIDTSIMAAQWLEKNKEIPFCIVSYDDVIAKPVETLNRVFSFLDVPKPKAVATSAAGVVDPKLKRSLPGPKESLLWGDAGEVHWLLSDGDFTGINKFAENKDRPSYRENNSWPCVRCNTRMVEAHCKQCYSDESFAKAVRRGAESKGVNWRVKPCAWEVAYRTDGEPLISIDDSVAQNHWVTEDDRKKEEFEIKRREWVKIEKKRRQQVSKLKKEKTKKEKNK